VPIRHTTWSRGGTADRIIRQTFARFIAVVTPGFMTGGGFKNTAKSAVRPVWGFTHPWPK